MKSKSCSPRPLLKIICMLIMNKIYFLSLTAVTSMLLSCSNQQKKTPVKEKIYPVLSLKEMDANIFTDYPASIQGIQNIEIRPKIDGYVEAIYIDEGATVKKGQLLFKINAPQYEQDVKTAEANIKIAVADVNSAQMQVDKVKPIVDQNIVSPYELKAAQYALQSKQGVLAQARAALNNAQTNLSYTIVKSPSDGVVGLLPFKIGSLVNSSTTSPLTTVSNIDHIYAYFSINEKKGLDFFMSVKGNTMQQKLETLPLVSLVLANGSILPEKGKVETASGLINAQTGALNMRATFPNSSGLVKSGSSAIVRIPETVNNVLLIPQKSTYQIQGKLFVYVLGADQTVKSVPVVVKAETGNCYVIQNGLNSGNKIITDGISNLREGLKVKVQPISAAAAYNSL